MRGPIFLGILVLTEVLLIIEGQPDHIQTVSKLKRRQRQEEDEEDQEENKLTPPPIIPLNTTAEPLGPVTIKSFRGFIHAVDSSDVILLDDKTLEIPDFSYDGEGPASWFVVGQDGDYTQERVDLPDITVIPDENESCEGLKRYNSRTIRLTLPGKMRMSDISYLALYCLRFNHNFGYVAIPDDLKLPRSTRDTSRLEECEDVESSETGNGATSGSNNNNNNNGNRRPRPPQRQRPRPRPNPADNEEEETKRPGLLGGLLNLLG